MDCEASTATLSFLTCHNDSNGIGKNFRSEGDHKFTFDQAEGEIINHIFSGNRHEVSALLESGLDPNLKVKLAVFGVSYCLMMISVC